MTWSDQWCKSSGTEVWVRIPESTNAVIPAGLSVINKLELDEGACAELPESLRRVDFADLERRAHMVLPASMVALGGLVLASGATLACPPDLRSIEYILLDDFARFVVPLTVAFIGGVTIEEDAYLELPPILEGLSSVLLGGPCHLSVPAGITTLERLELRNESTVSFDGDLRSITELVVHGCEARMPRGVEAIDEIVLTQADLATPESLRCVTNVWLADASTLRIPEATRISGRIETDETSEVLRTS